MRRRSERINARTVLPHTQVADPEFNDNRLDTFLKNKVPEAKCEDQHESEAQAWESFRRCPLNREIKFGLTHGDLTAWESDSPFTNAAWGLGWTPDEQLRCAPNDGPAWAPKDELEWRYNKDLTYQQNEEERCAAMDRRYWRNAPTRDLNGFTIRPIPGARPGDTQKELGAMIERACRIRAESVVPRNRRFWLYDAGEGPPGSPRTRAAVEEQIRSDCEYLKRLQIEYHYHNKTTRKISQPRTPKPKTEKRVIIVPDKRMQASQMKTKKIGAAKSSGVQKTQAPKAGAKKRKARK